MQFHWMDPELDLLRVAIAIITTYMFFNRKECGACALSGDIVVGIMLVTLLLREKRARRH